MNVKYYNDIIKNRIQRTMRREFPDADFAARHSALGTPAVERMTERFEIAAGAEQPHIFEGQQIVFMRTIGKLPDIFMKGEWRAIKVLNNVHENGYQSNYTPDYISAINSGLLSRLEGAGEHRARVIKAILDLAERYRKHAEEIGRQDVAEVLAQVPAKPARTLREALQFFRILHYALWLEGDYHNTVGRFDLHFAPYYYADIAAGRLTKESALELIEDFFISFNIDSDMYSGIQQGDNGQSLMLGGLTAEGGECFSEFSELCLIASRNLRVIDPKINLRVNKNTPESLYELGTTLTAVGLGFPQYSNDDVVIPGLLELGYDYADAVNYSVAACWECIIPGCAMDVVNYGSMNLSLAVREAIVADLGKAADFESLMGSVRENIEKRCSAMVEARKKPLWQMPSPFLEMLFSEIKYRNFGFHGAGIASAADQLAAVKKYVFDEKTVAPARLIEVIESNFENDPELLHLLRYEAPKMGNDEDEVDSMACKVLEFYADALRDKRNIFGGRFRAGTGTALMYINDARNTPATADGRRDGESFGANYAPNLFSRISGPVSLVRSFSKPDLAKTINGGPFTVEFSADMFKNDEARSKTAKLVKHFIDRGGHQIQLNAVSLEDMLDAQVNPEAHRSLIVRVWGWSGYFVELDRCYQDHVIARRRYTV